MAFLGISLLEDHSCKCPPGLPRNERVSQAWWCPPVIPAALRGLRQEDHQEFKATRVPQLQPLSKHSNHRWSKEMAQPVGMLVV